MLISIFLVLFGAIIDMTLTGLLADSLGYDIYIGMLPYAMRVAGYICACVLGILLARQSFARHSAKRLLWIAVVGVCLVETFDALLRYIYATHLEPVEMAAKSYSASGIYGVVVKMMLAIIHPLRNVCFGIWASFVFPDSPFSRRQIWIALAALIAALYASAVITKLY